jgi:D-tyrosyl-tRNA(Tyr) deacylase
MKALLQRVSEASVRVATEEVSRIGPGLLVFLGMDRGDDRETAERLLRRVLDYRLFADEEGRMNRSLVDCGGQILLVSQFTLAADTRSGRRPGFSTALAPAQAEPLYEACLGYLRRELDASRVAGGRFGAHMRVALVNDGPVTFLLEA